MGDHLLVPYDGSEQSKTTLEYAIETVPEASLTALYVIPASPATERRSRNRRT